ncbi:integral membrane protein PTH11-like protein [Penicillium citrinum]|uniref:Integral membrane protein PTH11-like protein n=1 Tax=Penicillium citrinum TaxID=5077 RepID=A0A9W9NNI9_PENCI|nr:integral membrane protein PTH11-like protein [Penicillium citrinum]KAJ5223155.1 integral membrane protein PTH11-like protein [Penicillium citrinum]
MSTSVFGEPPPGTDLSANHTSNNNAAVIITYIIAAIAVALRFYTRWQVRRVSIAADDWMSLAALVSVTASFASTIIGGYHGLGKHVWIVPIEDVVTVMQILFAYVLIYVVTVPLIKFSILLLYRRIFGMTWTIWVCMLLTAGYFVSCTVAFLVCCQPVSYYWSQYIDPTGGKCVFDLYPFYIGNAAANLTTDVLILLVPIPLTWRLQMRTSQKILIIGIFLLGGFVCVASIVRIYYMTFLANSVDITWIMGDVFIWSSVEPCIGILCACLPTLKPLLRHALHHISIFSSSKNTNSSHTVSETDDDGITIEREFRMEEEHNLR